MVSVAAGSKDEIALLVFGPTAAALTNAVANATAIGLR
jgi:hypothetical protein